MNTNRFSKVIAVFMVGGCGAFFSTSMLAQSHNYIGIMRSGADASVFVSQSVEGMYGRFSLHGDNVENNGADAVAGAIVSNSGASSAFWQGYNVRTALGIELLKFIQFSIAHSSVTVRSRSSGFENLRGSSLNGEVKLVFQSPIGNLESGAGAIGSRYDFQRKLEDASFYGSGLYYLLGWNYFISYQVSLFATAKISNEHLERNSGSSSIGTIDTNMNSLGLGFNIWL